MERQNYSYALFWMLSLLIALLAWGSGLVKLEDGKLSLSVSGSSTLLAKAGTFDTEQEQDFYGPMQMVGPIQQEDSESASASEPETVVVVEPTQVEEEEPAEEEVPEVFFKADSSWFDDALFIGDSRTVGLSEYGGLGNAAVAAKTGLSVYKVFSCETVLPSGETGTLEQLLMEQSFGKIYVMLGINELGYSFDRTIATYQEMVEQIRELQPDALIFLQANLRVTKEYSESSDVINNENIDRLNQAVSELADGETIFYLDVNDLFDDGEGNLAEEYTSDDVHVLAKYYPDWVEWLLEHAVSAAQ